MKIPRSSIGLKITVLVLCGASIVFALALAYSYFILPPDYPGRG